ncbi:MAG TPA: aspartate dehydrogenase [Paracoccaceae bacterium]|nr:aspartate dehydrogenase [Paracoccaceae bacterium]HMO70183.1 aspartate dehydrogenase [Paracoccaceae bacterium]
MTLRLVLVGWGAIATEVARVLDARGAGVVLAGIALRDPGRAQGLPPGVPVLTDPAGLSALAPDLVVEAAGRAAVLPWGVAALATGADFAPASTSAFADPAVLPALVAAAQAAGRQVIVPPGALGGVDALAAAARLPLTHVRHEIVKPPAAWAGTGADALCDLAALPGPVAFFEGTAAEAAARFPQNANVAMITALAGIGPDRTTVALVADPGAARNRHRVVAEGDFGRMEIVLENLPLAANPKTSALTALSLVRLVENRAGPLSV